MKSKIKTTSLGLVIGSVIGGVTTALFTPFSGKELRTNVKTKTIDTKSKIKEKVKK